LRATWAAIHIETSRSLRLGEGDKNRIAECLRLAEHLGGEALTVPAADVPSGVLDYAQAHNVTHVVIAKSQRSRWSELWRSSITHALIRKAGAISVHVIAEDRIKTGEDAPADIIEVAEGFTFAQFAGTLAMVAGAVIAGVALREVLAVSNLAL